MGGVLSTDLDKERWIRSPSMCPHKLYIEPDATSAANSIPVLKRRRSQPMRTWRTEVVEIIERPKRSSSAPPTVGTGRSESKGIFGGLVRSLSQKSKTKPQRAPSLKLKKSTRSLVPVPPPAKKPKKDPQPQKSLVKPKLHNTIGSLPIPVPPPPAPLAVPAGQPKPRGPPKPAKPESPTETESESQPEPMPEPEEEFSMAKPRLAKWGSKAPALTKAQTTNPWAADVGNSARPEGAYSFANPRISNIKRTVPPKGTYTADKAMADVDEKKPGDGTYKRPIPKASYAEGVSSSVAPQKAPERPIAPANNFDFGWPAPATRVEERRTMSKNMIDLLGDDPLTFGGGSALGGGPLGAVSSAGGSNNRKGRRKK